MKSEGDRFTRCSKAARKECRPREGRMVEGGEVSDTDIGQILSETKTTNTLGKFKERNESQEDKGLKIRK